MRTFTKIHELKSSVISNNANKLSKRSLLIYVKAHADANEKSDINAVQ